jgi:hypothetical protein
MFRKDSGEEEFLTRFGAKWSYVNDITYDQLVPNWEMTNLGRERARVEDAILEYAERMAAGAAAPAGIFWKTSRGFDPLDGVQRLCAHLLNGGTRFPGYIVETESALLARRIRVFANHLLNGRSPSTEWTRRQAIQICIIEGGMSVEEVAQLGGWKKEAVAQDWLYLDWSFKIRCAGGPEELPKGVVLNIAECAKPDDLHAGNKPVAEFLHDLKQGKFTNGESKPFIDAFFGTVNRNGKKDLHGQFASRLEDFRSSEEVRTRLEGRKPNPRNPDTKLLAAMKTVKTIADDLIATRERLFNIDEFFRVWNQVERSLKQLRDAVKATAK